MPSPPKCYLKVGLLWHSASSGNLGVGALTIANMSIASAVAESVGVGLRFTIIGMKDGDITYLDPEEAEVFAVDVRSLLSPAGTLRVLGGQDILIDIGGGDSFAEIYGLKRFMFLWLTKMQAISQGVPLVLAPQTIGPFEKTPYKQMAGFALERAGVVVARDPASMECIAKVAPTATRALAVDVAFALPFEDRAYLRGAPILKVGVNVSGLLFNEAESGRNRFSLEFDYAALSRCFIRELTARKDIEVHLVTHVNPLSEGWDDDGGVADRLADEFPDAIRVPNFAGPIEAKTYISGLDFLVAGRMHACIAAFSSGTPVVPIAYSRKFASLFGMLGYPWLIPERGLGTEQALEYLLDAMDNRSELAAATRTGMQQVETLLDRYRSELRDAFLRLARQA